MSETSAAAAGVARQMSEDFGGPERSAEGAPALPGAIAAHLVAALLLIWPAFRNGYPLVFADTGTYLGQALLGYLGWDRPPFYSLFLLAADWRLSLWPAVLLQGLLLAHLLGLVLRALGRPERLALPAAAAALAVLTPLPWFAAQLMPDFFTGMVVLTLWLLGFRATILSTGERLYLLVLATLAVMVHQSHLPLALGLVAVSAPLLARQGWRAARQPLLRMAVPPLLAAVAMLGVNAIGHGRLSLSPYGSVFLATRLIYDGPGLEEVHRACPESGWRICDALQRLPGWHNGFLWLENSPLQQELGGPKAWAPEASAIIAATLRDHPLAVLISAVSNTVEQLRLAAPGDGLEPWLPPQGPEPLIARFYPDELAAFRSSLQQTGRLQAEAQAMAPLQLAVMLLGTMTLLLLALRWRRLSLPALALALMVLAAVLGNAAITGALSGPAARYGSRLAWLLPFAPAAILAGLRLAPQPATARLRPRLPG